MNERMQIRFQKFLVHEIFLSPFSQHAVHFAQIGMNKF